VDPTGHNFWDVLLGVFVFVFLAVLCVVSFGALAVLSSALAMAFAFTLGFAALGAAAFATVALAQGLSPLSADFWVAVGTGFVLGAIIGAGLCAMWALTFGGAAAAAGLAGFIKGMCLSALVGAMFGAIEATATHFKNGGGPESLLLPMLESAGIGAAISAATFGLFKGAANLGWFTKGEKAFLSFLAFVFNVAKVGHASATGSTWTQSLVTGAQLMLLELLAYRASPSKGTGVPAWAFSGTTAGWGGARDREGLAPLLQTMPLAL
jgi:hypothetical protein